MQFITQDFMRKSMLTVDGRLWMREIAANVAKAGETKSPAKLAARIIFQLPLKNRGTSYLRMVANLD